MFFKDLFNQIKDQICAALYASKLLNQLSELNENGLRDTYLEKSSEFEQIAIGVLKSYDRNTNEFMNSLLLTNKTTFSKINIMDMAFKCDCRKFFAQKPVQDLLEKKWYGKEESKIVPETNERLYLVRKFYNFPSFKRITLRVYRNLISILKYHFKCFSNVTLRRLFF